MTIDMKNYMGEDTTQVVAPAAKEQETNSYQNEVHDAPLEGFSPEAATEAVKEPIAEKPVEDPQQRNFEALRGEVDRIKAEREAEKREYQLQLELMRANTAAKTFEEKPKQMFEDMQDTDIPNVSELRRAFQARESEYQARISELQFAQSHNDYGEVLEKHLTPLIKQKPRLAQWIQSAPNPAEAAYELGKLAQQAQGNQQQTVSDQKLTDTQRMVENSRRPGTLSQAGGQNVLSKADYYANMSDAEFLSIVAKNMSEI